MSGSWLGLLRCPDVMIKRGGGRGLVGEWQMGKVGLDCSVVQML